MKKTILRNYTNDIFACKTPPKPTCSNVTNRGSFLVPFAFWFIRGFPWWNKMNFPCFLIWFSHSLPSFLMRSWRRYLGTEEQHLDRSAGLKKSSWWDLDSPTSVLEPLTRSRVVMSPNIVRWIVERSSFWRLSSFLFFQSLFRALLYSRCTRCLGIGNLAIVRLQMNIK